MQVLGMAARTQKEFYERLDAFTLQGEDSLVDSALVQAVEKGVMPWTKIPHAKKAFYHPQHEQFDKPSAWSLFNAVTEITKKYSTDTMAERTIGFSDLFHDIFTPDLKKVSIN